MKNNEQKQKTGAITLIEDSTSVTIAARKEWQKLTGIEMNALHSYSIIGTLENNGTYYFLLMDMNPLHLGQYSSKGFKLLKYGKNETGEPICLVVDLSMAEADYLRTSWLNIIETDKGGEQD